MPVDLFCDAQELQFMQTVADFIPWMVECFCYGKFRPHSLDH